jgi:hypothetical protein
VAGLTKSNFLLHLYVHISHHHQTKNSINHRINEEANNGLYYYKHNKATTNVHGLLQIWLIGQSLAIISHPRWPAQRRQVRIMEMNSAVVHDDLLKRHNNKHGEVIPVTNHQRCSSSTCLPHPHGQRMGYHLYCCP